jgi:hypothetical protein
LQAHLRANGTANRHGRWSENSPILRSLHHRTATEWAECVTRCD